MRVEQQSSPLESWMQCNCLIEDQTVEDSVTTRMYPAMEVNIPERDNNGCCHNLYHVQGNMVLQISIMTFAT
jgi:hypothetical protein